MIGGITVAIWLIHFFRRLAKNLHSQADIRQTGNSNTQASLQRRLSIDSLQQPDGQGIVREKPDDHIQEMHVLPTEKPDDQIHEMASEPTGSSNDLYGSGNIAN